MTAAFDEIMTGTDPAMVIVTTTAGNERGGCLVGFHSQSGMEPGSLSVWLSKANHTFRIATLADVFAVHFLGRGDHGLARLFGEETGDEIDKFDRCAWQPGPDGVPVLTEVASRVIGRKAALLETTADHVCLVLDPVDATTDGSYEPLRLSDVDDFDPGHAADERPTSPGRDRD